MDCIHCGAPVTYPEFTPLCEECDLINLEYACGPAEFAQARATSTVGRRSMKFDVCLAISLGWLVLTVLIILVTR